MHMLLGAIFALIIGVFRKSPSKNVMYKKAFRDLKANPGRTALVIFALVIGLWGVGTILVSYTILKNDLNENFLRTNPAHAVMTSEDFRKLNLDDFRKRPEVESAEFRDLTILRVEAFEDKWLPMMVYGVEDFNRFQLAKFYHESGKKIPDPGTILIERDALNVMVSNLKNGSVANIRANGKVIKRRITGISFDPAQAPATQDAFVYAYTDKKTYRELTGKGSNRRLILRFNDVNSKEEVKKLVQKVRDDFEKKGIALDSVDVPKFNEHPHQFQLNTLLMTNGIIGFLAFLMGAVLVSQLMGSILSRQVRQIGILKAVGASSFQVFSIYLTMVLVLGLVSSAIAIPLAIASGYGYAGFVAMIINFDILTGTLPHGVYAGLVLSGIFLPVLFSLSALLKGVRISVHSALADYGIAADSKKNVFLSLPFSNRTLLAIRNTFRRKKRILVTVATMALGVAIFNTGFNVRQSLADFLDENRTSMKYDVQVVLKEAVPVEKALAPFQNPKKYKSVEVWNGGKGRLQSKIISTMNSVGVVALPYDTDLMTWNVIQGRWLSKGGETEIVMNQGAVEAFDYPALNEVQPITIGGKVIQAKLVGIVKEFDIAKIYIDKERYDELVNPNHWVNSLMFTANESGYDEVLAFKKEIEKSIAASDLPILFVMSQAERAKIIYDHLNIILSILTFLALLVLIVSALGMASATGINIMERTREIGVLRAIGASPVMIYRLFVGEGMLVSLVSILGGMALAWPLSVLAAAYFGYLILGANTPLDFSFSYTGFLITLLITIAFGWLASRIPASKAVRVSTREALAYE